VWVVGSMAHWRWIDCLRWPTVSPSNTRTGVRPPPSERDRSTITMIGGDSDGC